MQRGTRLTLARSIAIATCITGAARASARAQRAPQDPPENVHAGDHLRGVLTADSSHFDGFVSAIDGDTIAIATCRHCSPTIHASVASIGDLEVERRRSHVTAGRVIGGVALGVLTGAAAGAGVGLAVAEYSVHHCAPNDDLCGLSFLAIPIGAIGGAGVGFVAGGAVALSAKESYWTVAAIPPSA